MSVKGELAVKHHTENIKARVCQYKNSGGDQVTIGIKVNSPIDALTTHAGSGLARIHCHAPTTALSQQKAVLTHPEKATTRQ